MILFSASVLRIFGKLLTVNGSGFMKKIKFESNLAKQLYIEVSALQDMKKVNRAYISQEYIWKVWQKVYKNYCGCTRYFINLD